MGGPAGSIDKECADNAASSLSVDPVGPLAISPRTVQSF